MNNSNKHLLSFEQDEGDTPSTRIKINSSKLTIKKMVRTQNIKLKKARNNGK